MVKMTEVWTSEFVNLITCILNQAIRGVEVVPDLEIIIDKKIREVSDIENIFKLKLMDKVNILANTLFLSIL